jgi:peptide/nickel transport system substrate-binding protein
MSQKLNRRQFLFTSAMAAAGVALASCKRPEVAVPPTAAPVAPVAPAAPTVAPTPRPSNTPIPTKPPATLVPTAVAAREAPMLQELVAAGKLPPLADRLPKNPLTLKPLHAIGKYGGVIRHFHMNLGNSPQNWMYGNSPLRWVDDGLNIAPGMVDTWAANPDNSEWTLHIREGLKWSDGARCTVDDVLYALDDLVLNPDHPDTATEFYTSGGAPVKILKIDDYTMKLKYIVPAPLTAKRLCMWVKGGIGPRWIAPKHYLKEFHPKYNSAVKDYVEHDLRLLWRQYPGSPSLTAWICESYKPGERRVWVRNPYYYCIDTEGNQLPYVDRTDETNIEDKEVQMLTIMQGGVDYLHHGGHRGGLADIAPLKAGEKDGKYRVILLDSGGGSGHYYFWNWDCPDAKYRDLYRNPKFKAAFNYNRDRERITQTLYYGLGEVTTGTMAPKAIEFNFNDEARAWYKKERDSYVEYDPEKAKKLLDEIGVKDVNNDGFREFPDGSKLELRVDFNATAGKSWLDGHEIAIADFAKIGLKMITNTYPDAEFAPMWRAGQGHIRGNWGIGDGPDHLVYPSWVVPDEPNRWSPLGGNYYLQRGTEKEDSEKDVDPWKRTPPRWLKSEPELIGKPALDLQALLDTALAEPDAIKRMQLVWQMLQIHIDEGKFGSGTTANTPVIYIYGNNLINAPAREETATGGFCGPWIVPHPALHNPETFAFK